MTPLGEKADDHCRPLLHRLAALRRGAETPMQAHPSFRNSVEDWLSA
jgi:hypothetical protein